jgi:hypothetical protein
MGMQIVKLTGENFKRLKAVEIEPRGNVIKITGRNAQGKSSTLDLIWAALGGKDASPEKPIRDGEKTASVTLDLGDLVVTRKWTEKGNYLEVTDAEGAAFPSPQKVLDRLYGKFTFDPARFLAEKDQRGALLQVVDLAPDWAAFKAASGMAAADPSDITDPLRYISDVKKAVYEKRRDLNRDAKTAESRVEAARQHVPDDYDADNAPDVEKLLAERRTAQEQIDLIKNAERSLERKRLQLTESQERVGELERQIQREKENQSVFSSDITALETDLGGLVLPNLDGIDAQIADANIFAASRAAFDNLTAAEAEAAAAADKAAVVDAKLTAIDAFTKSLLDGVKMPVPGLAITDDGITLDGIPFSQCSTAQQLKTSVAIGMAANPKLRVLRIGEGEKLDSASWAIIEEMAAANNFQIWVEQMDESGRVGIVIEDGEIAKNNYEIAE